MTEHRSLRTDVRNPVRSSLGGSDLVRGFSKGEDMKMELARASRSAPQALDNNGRP